jgi:hypothetical protein
LTVSLRFGNERAMNGRLVPYAASNITKILHEMWRAGLIPLDLCHRLATQLRALPLRQRRVVRLQDVAVARSEIGAKGSETIGGKVSAFSNECRSIATGFSNAVFGTKA